MVQTVHTLHGTVEYKGKKDELIIIDEHTSPVDYFLEGYDLVDMEIHKKDIEQRINTMRPNFGITSALLAASLVGLADGFNNPYRGPYAPEPPTKAQVKARNIIKKRRAKDKKNRKQGR